MLAGTTSTAAPSTRKPRSKREAAERLTTATAKLAERLPAAELSELALQTERAAIDESRESAGISALTGQPLAPREDVEAARLRNLQRAFADRHKLLSDAIGVRDVAELLQVGRQTPHDRITAGTLLAAKNRGQWRLPIWQFDADGPDGVLQGLPDVLGALRGPISDVGTIRWFTTPKDHLDGRTPLEALRQGQVDEVVQAAEALGAS